MSNPLDIPGKLFLIEFNNPKVSFRQYADGAIIRRVSFEVDETDWNVFVSGPSNIRLIGRLARVDDADDEQETIEAVEGETETDKPSKGQFGSYYQKAFRTGFLNAPQVKAALGLHKTASDTEAKEKLRETFEVDSMAAADPAGFLAWCDRHDLRKLLPKEAREIAP